jgi:hypothetical protein
MTAGVLDKPLIQPSQSEAGDGHARAYLAGLPA